MHQPPASVCEKYLTMFALKGSRMGRSDKVSLFCVYHY